MNGPVFLKLNFFVVPFNTAYKFLTMHGAYSSRLFKINLSWGEKLTVKGSVVKLMDE